MSDAPEQLASNFGQVFKEELNAIGKKESDPLIGLALSGGGIRSATFNLGVLQGLAANKVFDKFDYLSTVSGGGYIGSWLSAWIYHKSQPKTGPNFIRANTTIQDDLTDSTDANNDQSKPVEFLRDYSNYLTPHVGLFSMDTLSAVSTYTRNLILNQSILILALALILMLPRLLQKTGDFLIQHPDYFWHALGIDALFLITAIGMILLNLIYTDIKQSKAQAFAGVASVNKQPTSTACFDLLTSSFGVFVFIVTPILISGWLTSLILSSLAKPLSEVQPLLVVLYSGGIYLALWSFAYLISKGLVTQKHGKTFVDAAEELLQWAGFTFIAGCIGGGLFLAVIYFLASLYPHNEVLIPWLVVVFGPPVSVSIFSLVVVFHIGLMGRDLSVAQHEWWSRLGAPLLAAMVLWIGVFGIAVFGPPAFERLNIYLSATLTSGWLVSTIAGVWAGHSSATGEKHANKKLERVAQIAPYVFIIGILIAVSYGLQWAYSALNHIDASAAAEYYPAAKGNGDAPSFPELVKSNLQSMNTVTCQALLIGFSGIFIAMATLAWRVSINLFSLHNFYRNRLTRAYLGASRPQRMPHPFTGFDENDDIALAELAKQRPYHIINAAINFTDGGKLAVQDRKAASFVFTPNYCGYQPDALQNSGFYRESKHYGKHDKDDAGFRLGSAVAVSGAAASPNMGYHSSPAIAFLLTMFNVRLGRWCGNPANKNDSWQKSDPPIGFWYLLSELLGYASLKSNFVNLSDGGHFENLGLYELVRRKCAHIVVCDAGADEHFDFEDLAGAIRKCRTDFGVEIVLDLEGLRHKKQHNRFAEKHYGRYSEKHFALGTIDYGSYNKGKTGTLILLKPSLTEKGLPVDVRHYADINETFPQQTTGDQWFDEAQFESYRKLGYHVVQSLFADPNFDKKAHGLL